MRRIALIFTFLFSPVVFAQAVFQSIQVEAGPNDAFGIQFLSPGAKLCFSNDCFQDVGGALSFGGTGGLSFSGASPAIKTTTSGATLLIDGSSTGGVSIATQIGSEPVSVGTSGATINFKGTNQLGSDQSNFVRIQGAASASAPSIATAGADTNQNLNVNGVGTGGVNIGANQADYAQVSGGASGATLDVNAGTLGIGITTQTGLTLGRSGQSSTVNGTVKIAGGSGAFVGACSTSSSTSCTVTVVAGAKCVAASTLGVQTLKSVAVASNVATVTASASGTDTWTVICL